jgi:hypothetical protein
VSRLALSALRAAVTTAFLLILSAEPARAAPPAPTPTPRPATEPVWRQIAITDRSTDRTRNAASTTNAEGYALFVFRTQEGPVYGMFLPPPALRGQVGSRAPVLRVDAAPVVDLEARRKDPPGVWEAEPVILSENSVSILLAGKGKAAKGDLRHWMEGQKLSVRWYRADGAAVETSFELKGAGEVIAGAVGVPGRVDPVEKRAAAQQDAARRAALAKCGQWSAPSLQENCRREAMERYAD